ncbi:hypothetical protein A4D02_16395 [Niastella koreensis]|uniref:Uncharacterized protein n=2 Tax=Niastella koreensis TaxID=354356 RepID=G8TLU7_NIAKG|nr:hypothetical protein [Niastella koreensis]AEV97689.1 hypothetical protein Niako_1318 [Niastella koreensis GR20-10]OQP40490.1 hypothetical protein A4D02_16395 [Niastella koreensis]
MKNEIILVFLFVLSLAVKGQDKKAEFLTEPSRWEFERFPLPPTFAPNFPYKGVEELRFSPGMFKKEAPDYFSYAFVARLDSISSITQQEVKDYLLSYFKGLCASTAKQRNLSIDTSQVKVSIEKKIKTSANEVIYSAVLNVFGVFTDGAPVTLNAEIKAMTDLRAKKIYLVFITSPQKRTDNIWKQLYAIQHAFIMANWNE